MQDAPPAVAKVPANADLPAAMHLSVDVGPQLAIRPRAGAVVTLAANHADQF